MKKVISLIISFTILISAFSFNVFAAEDLSLAVSAAYDSNDNLYYNVSAWYKFDKDKSGNSVVIEMVKKSKGFSSVLSDSDIYYIDEAIIKEEVISGVRIGISHLKPAEKKLIYLRYWKQMTQEETAEVLRVTQQAVSYREGLILLKLKNFLKWQKNLL